MDIGVRQVNIVPAMLLSIILKVIIQVCEEGEYVNYMKWKKHRSNNKENE